MRQRGRPRHPDLLTPREWEVLSLVREGLSNREIGDRLGVSRDGIKYHISQILLKLGVSTREEAAAWQPPTAVPPAQPAALASRLSRFTRAGLIAAAGALLAGLVALGGAVAYSELSGDSGPSESADALGGGPPTASPDPLPTPSPDPALAPPVTSDGSLGSVAYVRDGNLWVLNLDTGEDRMVVQREVATTFGTTAADLTAHRPEWSADGQWVSFAINNAAFDYTSSWIVRPSDGLLQIGGSAGASDWSPIDLLLYGGGQEFRPVGSFADNYAHYATQESVTNVGYGEAKWSPDGQRLAVPEAQVRYVIGSDLNPEPPYRVSIIDPQSAQPTSAPSDIPVGVTRVFESDSGSAAPVIDSWSPDGKYILFWPNPVDLVAADLAMVSLDDPSDIVSVGSVPVMQSGAAWSPDGSLLAVVPPGGPIQMWQPGGDFLYNVGGDGVSDPSWLPDGARIAFSKLGRITTAAADGGDQQQLTSDDSYEDRYPQYSGDGSRILFVRLNAESVANSVASSSELWLMNADGSDAHKVVDLPAVDVSIGGKARSVDWTRYLSWYRPNGVAPFEVAPGPSPFPTVPFSTPVPGVVNTSAVKPTISE